MVTLPNTHPVIDDVAGVEFIARRARENRRSKIYCYGALTRGFGGKELVEMACWRKAARWASPMR